MYYGDAVSEIVRRITVFVTKDMSLVLGGVSFCQRDQILLWNHLLTNIYEKGGLSRQNEIVVSCGTASFLSLNFQGYLKIVQMF